MNVQLERTRDVVGFGLGVTVGAGVFMATGKAAQEAGPALQLPDDVTECYRKTLGIL